MSILIYITITCIGYIFYKVYQMFKVPEGLKNIPTIPLYYILPSMIKGEPFNVRYEKYFRPVLAKYGYAKMWTQGQWELVLDNPQECRTILSKAGKFLKQRPGDENNKKLLFRKVLGNKNILFNDGEVWHQHRRVANPAFKKAWPIKLFTDCTQELIEKISSYNEQPIVTQDLFQKLTLDALGRGMFSYDFEAVKNGDKNYNLRLYNDVMEGAFNPIYGLMPFLENLTPSRRRLHRKALEFRKFLKDIIQSRKKDIEEHSDKDDLLAMMIKASSDEKGEGQLSDEDVVSDLATFFLAGHDTTANTLSSMFYFLSIHPDIQDKARREVLSVLGPSAEVIAPTTEQLKDMPYIDCIIKETMRCVTTVPQLRRFSKEETVMDSGLVIPKDTYINVQNWGIHHDAGMYKDPDVFKPERFSSPHSPEESQWMAFGYGSRMCIGKNFSLIEQRVALAMLLQKFTFSLGPNSIHHDLPKLSVSGLLYPVDLSVKFSPRI